MGREMDRVMIVDDEDGVRHLLKRWLSDWGYDVCVAVSAADAVEQLTTQPAAIVLCDVMMPVHDGIWLAEQIARLWPDTAVIMASGAQDMSTVTRSRKQGAVDFVTKPFGREMLLQALRRVGERRAAQLSAPAV
jgi:DNA-binding NtrC family response regulator